MKNILEHKFLDIFCIFIIFLTAPLFFYKLGQSSLVSFDEAWYGDIARNSLMSGNFINLTWNGGYYIDHPPVGFLLITISENLFGINAFGVRFASALSGLLSMVVIYFLGKELFGRVVGLSSALVLPSSFWFLFRSRSGNLDIILVFLFLLTLFFAIKASKEKKFLLPWSISLTSLFLTKTLVPFTIIPSLLIIFWKLKYKWKDFIPLIVLIFGIVGGWFIFQIFENRSFLNHFFGIGLPGVSAQTSFLENFKLTKEYLHAGVGKWFWPGLLAIFAGLFLMQRRFLILSVFFFVFFAPFIFSSKGHIWHLIPLHPILMLAFFGFSYVILKRFIRSEIIILFLFLVLIGYVSFLQTKRSWYEFIDIPAFISDEEILSKEAGKYPYDLFIDGDFVPSAVFYSGKKVNQIEKNRLSGIFKERRSVLVITYQWQLDGLGIKKDQYEVLKTDRDKMLILIK
ncbi:hypothetical protein A3F00_00115 [Candidatus Daviesbacteria bacterium RIFCSPHIGHO2_12_FULL_37_11]|uniref:Glycosyltransferase RgtA/B/C/D-like domain-containing protein n=1 Tax=Candidatus Daviesbacteria bacterium RIFCSPHIGHO2_12_FULL_37_11 TaxID=1797777 RepID=A0A1F5KAR4_9BACT|nr:MAG: hypothetical protein A3F00_00115 [Candidatus Daviesbacteria bacterium RIFCSPHIGHO2_12_FULL_37_11]